ncbi:MAG: thioredoxin domain-containing protein [Flavobacteriaceae bacterium]|nr:thioredoxin domain-containing protein [Flavobacteriaceae bacterium]
MLKPKYTNDLIKETSPYLLQHAHNPINWHAWNEETLALAKKEGKLILISIGYAACHWCHVMEYESFEDEEVAKIMNANFICIKVDREERPDVDQIYMDAVQLMTGSGGWPLNCIAMSDGRPVWGGTYFQKNKWINTLKQILKLKEKNLEKLEEQAKNLTEGVSNSGLIYYNADKPIFTKEELKQVIANWYDYMDLKMGGRIGSPKFPMPNNFQFLLRYAVQANDKKILDYVNLTLTKMALGGINDQIGGGFARYSVDNRWHIPHFEKMLYDNGQMVSLYANAFMATKNELYKETVYETTKFIERELMNEVGAFYSSLDADSDNPKGKPEEGAFYVWKKEELQKILKDDFDLFATYYNINANGLWQHGNYNLIRIHSKEKFCEEQNISVKTLLKKDKNWKKILLKERTKRVRPRLDDKILTSWNALMLKGYINAYTAFNDQHFLDIALKNANFIAKKQLQGNGSLFRNYKNGKSNIPAYLEDYATVADAFISLYEVTFDEKWLKLAKQLTDYSFDHFFDDKSRMFFFTSNLEKNLIARKMDTDDNVIPSSNSIMALNLFKLGHYYTNGSYLTTAKTMLNNVKNKAIQYGAGASNWLVLYTNFISNYYEIAIVGKNAKEKLIEINKHYLPNKLIIASLVESKMPLLVNRFSENNTMIFICVDNACKMPTNDVKKALKMIKVNF